MAAEQRTMTSPKAIIKVDGKPIGYIRNLRTTETIQRGSVQGLGRLTKRELPALAITCTWNCDFYLIDLNTSGIPKLDNRNVQTVDQYKNTKILLERPVDIYVYKKDNPTVENGVVTAYSESVFAIVRNVYLNSSGWDITENQISARNQSGEYTDPIILPE